MNFTKGSILLCSFALVVSGPNISLIKAIAAEQNNNMLKEGGDLSDNNMTQENMQSLGQDMQSGDMAGMSSEESYLISDKPNDLNSDNNMTDQQMANQNEPLSPDNNNQLSADQEMELSPSPQDIEQAKKNMSQITGSDYLEDKKDNMMVDSSIDSQSVSSDDNNVAAEGQDKDNNNVIASNQSQDQGMVIPNSKDINNAEQVKAKLIGEFNQLSPEQAHSMTIEQLKNSLVEVLYQRINSLEELLQQTGDSLEKVQLGVQEDKNNIQSMIDSNKTIIAGQKDEKLAELQLAFEKAIRDNDNLKQDNEKLLASNRDLLNRIEASAVAKNNIKNQIVDVAEKTDPVVKPTVVADNSQMNMINSDDSIDKDDSEDQEDLTVVVIEKKKQPEPKKLNAHAKHFQNKQKLPVSSFIKGKRISEQDGLDMYRKALFSLRAEKYDLALSLFLNFLDNFKNHKLAPTAQYWIGETHYMQGNYKRAMLEFLKAYRMYPNSDVQYRSLYKLGSSMEKIGKRDEACVMFFKVYFSRNDSSIALSDLARNKISNLSCAVTQ